MTEQGKYYIPHNPSFFPSYMYMYITIFPLKMTSASDTSTSMYSVEFTFYFSAKSICKVMGMRCIRNKRLGAALTWFLRSKVSYKHLIYYQYWHIVSLLVVSLILVILSL